MVLKPFSKKGIKRLRWIILLLLMPTLGGCIGSAVLKRGASSKKETLKTPSLHSVPDRPPKTPPEETPRNAGRYGKNLRF